MGAVPLQDEPGPTYHYYKPRHSTQADRFDEAEPRSSMTSMRPLGRVGTGLGSEIDMSTGVSTPGESRSLPLHSFPLNLPRLSNPLFSPR